MVISATLVGCAKRPWRCETCRELIEVAASYVALFGMAETGDPPYRIRLCLTCAEKSPDSKIVAALGGRPKGDAARVRHPPPQEFRCPWCRSRRPALTVTDGPGVVVQQVRRQDVQPADVCAPCPDCGQPVCVRVVQVLLVAA